MALALRPRRHQLNHIMITMARVAKDNGASEALTLHSRQGAEMLRGFADIPIGSRHLATARTWRCRMGRINQCGFRGFGGFALFSVGLCSDGSNNKASQTSAAPPARPCLGLPSSSPRPCFISASLSTPHPGAVTTRSLGAGQALRFLRGRSQFLQALIHGFSKPGA